MCMTTAVGVCWRVQEQHLETTQQTAVHSKSDLARTWALDGVPSAATWPEATRAGSTTVRAGLER